MSAYRTVGTLTAEDIGETITLTDERGTVVGTLLSVDHHKRLSGDPQTQVSIDSYDGYHYVRHIPAHTACIPARRDA